ncbi:MAG: helix-turn-helix domain-containing protein [Pseudonocardiaceae bacterium]
MDIDDERTIGWRLWRVRDARGKSLRVIAELAGMSKATLSRIERGERSPTLNEIVALADALQISVSELTRLPVPAPANGHTDSTIEAIGLALDAIDVDQPGGLVLPVAVLRDQVADIHRHGRACQFAKVATDLPGLIRDLHTTLATGTDHGELLELAVYLHVHATRSWLRHAAAPAHLLRRVVFLARRLAQERGEVTTLAVAGVGVVDVLRRGGALDLAQAELDATTVPPTTAGTAGLIGVLTSKHALIAALARRPGDVAAPMDAAAELADRFGATGEIGSLGFLYPPAAVGKERMWLALETGEPDRAVSIAQDVDPGQLSFPVNRAQYWIDRGRASARLRGRHDDAVRALRTAESIFPTKVHRDAMVRDVFVVLLRHSRRNAVGQELQAMARRAGLSV